MELLPFPKFQLHDVAPPVDLSVKVTSKGAQPEEGLTVKSATTAFEKKGTVKRTKLKRKYDKYLLIS